MDSGTATTGPVTPEQYSVLLARHFAYDEEGRRRAEGAEPDDVTAIVERVKAETTSTDTMSDEQKLRVYRESVLAPAGVTSVVNRMVRNIRVYFNSQNGHLKGVDGGDRDEPEATVSTSAVDGGISISISVNALESDGDREMEANEKYWNVLSSYFEALDLLEQEELHMASAAANKADQNNSMGVSAPERPRKGPLSPLCWLSVKCGVNPISLVSELTPTTFERK